MIAVVGSGLTQWDVGRKVEVKNTDSDHVHFANQGDSYAAKVPLKDGVAEIPDYLLQTGKPLFVYAVLNGVTMEIVSFSVRKREKPADYVYEKDKRDYIYTLIEDAKTATEAANKVAKDLRDAWDRGEFIGPPGKDGLPQPENPGVGKLLAVEEVTDGKVTRVGVTSVASTCDLAQPRWGAKVLLSVPGDPGFGYHVEMTEGEYQSLMERCKEVVVVYGDGSSHETYVAYDGDNNMGNGQCLYCYDEDGTGTLLLLRDLAPIPEYLLAGGPTVKSVNGEKPDENGNVMLFLGTEEDSPMHILAGIVCTDENHGTGVVESYQDEVFDLETVLPFAYEGRLCFCLQWVTDKLEEYVLPLTVILSNDAIETDALVFCGSIGAGRTLTVTVAPDGSFTYALTEAVGSGDLGDVSTALDHIIALQEELIGGDGT